MRPMPIGMTDFKNVIGGGYYFVDKTDFLKQLIEPHAQVILCARPRRFGKTMTLSMVKYFFEIDLAKENRKLFDGLSIAADGSDSVYMREQGKYPVIFLSFREAKLATWKDTYKLLCSAISAEYERFRFLTASDQLSPAQRVYVQKIADGMGERSDYATSLKNLTLFLYHHYGMQPIVLLDEYDVPVQAGYMNGFYQEVVDFMYVWMTGGLKDNSQLKFALLTGVLRVAKESIFSGLNNPEVHTILSEKYSDVFGFTQEEVCQIARAYNREDKLAEIKAWYDGYQFGGRELYNPWSVLNYFAQGCKAKAYWLHTSSNDIIYWLLKKANIETKENLEKLLRGEEIYSFLQDNFVYTDVEKSKVALYTMLVMTGYLKVVKEDELQQDLYYLTIPNQELALVYRQEIVNGLVEDTGMEELRYLLQDLIGGDTVRVENKLQRFLKEAVSCYDTKESFYHGMLLGMMATLANGYEVASNRESGYGRFDLAMLPKQARLPGIIMEFKLAETEEDMEKVAVSALRQIEKNAYTTELEKRGVERSYCYGVAFYKKKVKVMRG